MIAPDDDLWCQAVENDRYAAAVEDDLRADVARWRALAGPQVTSTRPVTVTASMRGPAVEVVRELRELIAAVAAGDEGGPLLAGAVRGSWTWQADGDDAP